MKTMKDYHDLYNKSDVLQLTDVFEEYRDMCLKHYDLDPSHFYTAPGLSWDALLKETKVELELIKDYDMLLMIEGGIRGGVSVISHRYGKANNKYLLKTFDKNKPSSHLVYLDANGLYSWAMLQYLPTGDF